MEGVLLIPLAILLELKPCLNSLLISIVIVIHPMAHGAF